MMNERTMPVRRRSKNRAGAVLRRRPILWRPRVISTVVMHPKAQRVDAEVRRLVSKSL
jgi:hypothetical protein